MKKKTLLFSFLLFFSLAAISCGQQEAVSGELSVEESGEEASSESNEEILIRVSPDGEDSADGISAPVGTVSRALEITKEKITGADVRIDLADGTYLITEPIMISQQETDGENGHTLTLEGHGNSIISGGVAVSSWEEAEEHIWKAELPDRDGINGFYVDGKPQTLARLKVRASFADGEGHGGITQEDRKSYMDFSNYNSFAMITKCIFTTREDYSLDYEKLVSELPHIRLYFDQTFTRTVLELESVTDNDGSYTFALSEDSLKLLNGAKMADYDTGANRHYLVNSYLFLDEEGEYYFDKENRTLYYYSESSPEGRDCVAAVSEGLLSIQGTKQKLAANININNLCFAYGTSSVLVEHPYKEMQSDSFVIGLRDEEIEDKDYRRMELPAQITLDLAAHVNISGCSFQNFDTTGIALRTYVYDTTITDSRIENMAGSGIAIGTFNLKNGYGIEDKDPLPEDPGQVYSVKKNSIVPAKITVSNNVISNCGIESISSNGILLYYGYDVVIAGNTVENIGGSGISLGWGWGNWSIKQSCTQNSGNILVEKNKVISPCRKVTDAGGIYTLGAFFGEGLMVRDNFIDMEGAIKENIPAIYPDEGSEKITFTNNVSVHTSAWLWARALPIAYVAGKYEGGKPEGNTLMNCSVTGNYSDAENHQKSYTAGYTWPYASEISSANFIIKDNVVDEDWQNNETIMSIVNGAGAQGG